MRKQCLDPGLGAAHAPSISSIAWTCGVLNHVPRTTQGGGVAIPAAPFIVFKPLPLLVVSSHCITALDSMYSVQIQGQFTFPLGSARRGRGRGWGVHGHHVANLPPVNQSPISGPIGARLADPWQAVQAILVTGE